VAFAALFLSVFFGGVSLIFWLVGWFRAELVIAGIAEMLFSLDFLIAGVGVLYAAGRTVRSREGRWLGRIGVTFVYLFCAACWITIGVNGIVRPPLLRAAFGRF